MSTQTIRAESRQYFYSHNNRGDNIARSTGRGRCPGKYTPLLCPVGGAADNMVSGPDSPVTALIRPHYNHQLFIIHSYYLVKCPVSTFHLKFSRQYDDYII